MASFKWQLNLAALLGTSQRNTMRSIVRETFQFQAASTSKQSRQAFLKFPTLPLSRIKITEKSSINVYLTKFVQSKRNDRGLSGLQM